MKSISYAFLATLMGASAAFAQTPPSTSTTPPAVATSSGNNTTAAPVPGKNSFTEKQAKARLHKQGYSKVKGLHQDENSIWRGTALKDGKTVDVSVDYQGNVTAQ